MSESNRYDTLFQRLLTACNLDPEICSGLHEDAIVTLIQHKVGEFDKRIETAQRAVEHWREMAEGEHCERLKAEAERDAAIQCLVMTSRVQRSDGIQYRWVDIFTVCGREFRNESEARAYAMSLIQPKPDRVIVTDNDGEPD